MVGPARAPDVAQGRAHNPRRRHSVKVIVIATAAQVAAARRATPPPRDHDGTPLRPPRPPRPLPPPHPTHAHPAPAHPAPAHPAPAHPAAAHPGGSPPGGSSSPPPWAARPRAALTRAAHPTAVPPGSAPPEWHASPSPGPRSPPPPWDGRCATPSSRPSFLGTDREVLTLGRTTRLASKAQRTALTARDRGCIAPGCPPCPPPACHAHHITWWRNGGTTDIDNLALVCTHHHTLIHTGEWHLQIHAGIPLRHRPHLDRPHPHPPTQHHLQRRRTSPTPRPHHRTTTTTPPRLRRPPGAADRPGRSRAVTLALRKLWLLSREYVSTRLAGRPLPSRSLL